MNSVHLFNSLRRFWLALVNITKERVSIFAALCQSFPAAVWHFCLFVGLSSLSIRGEMLLHTAEIGLLTLDFKNYRVAFTVCFESLSICTSKFNPIIAAFGWIFSQDICLHSDSSSCSGLLSQHEWKIMLCIMGCSRPSPYSLLPIILPELNCNFVIIIIIYQSATWPFLKV